MTTADVTLITSSLLHTTVDDVANFTKLVRVQPMAGAASNVADLDISPSCASIAYKRKNEAIRLYLKSASENNIHRIKMVQIQ
jgi:hypothetical protein